MIRTKEELLRVQASRSFSGGPAAPTWFQVGGSGSGSVAPSGSKSFAGVITVLGTNGYAWVKPAAGVLDAALVPAAEVAEVLVYVGATANVKKGSNVACLDLGSGVTPRYLGFWPLQGLAYAGPPDTIQTGQVPPGDGREYGVIA